MSTTQPDREGWWWAKLPGQEAMPERVYVDPNDGKLYAVSREDGFPWLPLDRFEWGARILEPEENLAEMARRLEEAEREAVDAQQSELAMADRLGDEALAELAALRRVDGENLMCDRSPNPDVKPWRVGSTLDTAGFGPTLTAALADYDAKKEQSNG